MNAPEKITLPDEQSRLDTRNIAITRVGVRGIKHPIEVPCGHKTLPTVATLEMTVGLPPEVKGTHMSRFLEVLQENNRPFDAKAFRAMASQMLDRLEAKDGTIKMQFTYFVEKIAPISGVASLMDYEVTMEAQCESGQVHIYLTVLVPVTSLCPCSKNISDYGAHNQRSHITIRSKVTDDANAQTLIDMAEQSASCELWGLLKRPDEKYVTERAYDNPKFVEDLVRDVAIRLKQSPVVGSFTVESENFESIHNHSAVAWIEHVE